MRKITVEPGQTYAIDLPYSEVCMHMRVAGKKMDILVLPDGAQILDGKGNRFSSPITHGEAGIHRNSDKSLYTYVQGNEPEADKLRELEEAFDQGELDPTDIQEIRDSARAKGESVVEYIRTIK